MDLKKLRPSDIVVVVGAVLAIVGSASPWYGLRLTIPLEGLPTVEGTDTGWEHFAYLGWLVAILCAAAAVIAVLKIVTASKRPLPLPEPLLIMGAGGLSFLFVLARMVVRPSGWDLRWGIYVTLLGAAIVAAGGFLKNRSAS